MIEKGMVIILLIIGSYFDMKDRRIPIGLLLIGGGAVIADAIYHCYVGDIQTEVFTRTLGMIPGVLFLLLAFFTEERVGKGDGVVLIIIGLLTGFIDVLIIVCIGLFIQSLLACILLAMKKAKKQTQIPFIPFLLIAILTYSIYGIFYQV